MRDLRTFAALVATTLALSIFAGCVTTEPVKPIAALSAKAEHPSVVIQGVDGTLMAGELLNGSVTIASGQGELVLLTDHIHDITVSGDVDRVDSDSVKVSGKIKDIQFLLKSEHGVFTLLKERLKKIEFISNPAPVLATTDPKNGKGLSAPGVP